MICSGGMIMLAPDLVDDVQLSFVKMPPSDLIPSLLEGVPLGVRSTADVPHIAITGSGAAYRSISDRYAVPVQIANAYGAAHFWHPNDGLGGYVLANSMPVVHMPHGGFSQIEGGIQQLIPSEELRHLGGAETIMLRAADVWIDPMGESFPADVPHITTADQNPVAGARSTKRRNCRRCSSERELGNFVSWERQLPGGSANLDAGLRC